MAWPLTPLTTYLASSLPAIKAFDLNAIQNAITRIVRGTYSLAGIVLDGNGGGDANPPPGGIRASGAVSAANLAATAATASPIVTLAANGFGATAPQRKTLYADTLLYAAAVVHIDGTLQAGFNIARVTKPGTGQYDIRLAVPSEAAFAPLPSALVPVACAYGITVAFPAVIMMAADLITVQMFGTSGAKVDCGLSLAVFGR